MKPFCIGVHPLLSRSLPGQIERNEEFQGKEGQFFDLELTFARVELSKTRVDRTNRSSVGTYIYIYTIYIYIYIYV